MTTATVDIQGFEVGFQFGIYEGLDGVSFDPSVLHPDIAEFPAVMIRIKELWDAFELVCRTLDYATEQTDRLDDVDVGELINVLNDIEAVINQKHWTFDLDKIVLLRVAIRKEIASQEYRQRQNAIKQAKAEKLDKGYVYLIQSSSGAYKIGRTKHPEQRLKTFGVQLPFSAVACRFR